MTPQEFISGVERSQRNLRRFLASLCNGDTFTADDIAQETYMKAFLASDDMKDADKFEFWIFKIAYNTFLNFRRKEKHNVDIDEIRQQSSDSHTDENFRFENLYQALDTLPLKERSAVTLFYLQGYSSKEIADILETSDEAVRQAISRARKKLKDLIILNE